MRTNVCGIEKTLRIITGMILLGLYYFGIVNGSLGITLLITGAALLTTGLSGYCPINALLGINTCRKFLNKKTNQTA
jgi:hypothetical protein